MIDPFRTTYKELTPAQQELVASIKTSAQILLDVISKLSAYRDRERFLAFERVEEAVMWAVKGATE